jgi:hypothetical protein
MIDDNKLETLYTEYLDFTDKMVGEYGHMQVAAIMMTQALSIYKTAMSTEEYNRMVDTISSSRDKVKTFDMPITH